MIPHYVKDSWPFSNPNGPFAFDVDNVSPDDEYECMLIIWPFLQGHYNTGELWQFSFQQDNNPKHTAKATQKLCPVVPATLRPITRNKALGECRSPPSSSFPHIVHPLLTPQNNTPINWNTFNEFVCPHKLLVLCSGWALMKGLLIKATDYRLWFRLENQGTWKDVNCLPLIDIVQLWWKRISPYIVR